MKKRISALLILLLVFSLCFGASALAESADQGLSHVTDSAGLLTEEQVQSLEATAAELSGEGVELYLVTMRDFTEYSGGSIMDCAGELYEYFALGSKSDGSGVLLLISVDQMEYAVITRGQYGEYCFKNANMDEVEIAFLNAHREGDWIDTFEAYFEICGDILRTASANGLRPEMTDRSFPGLSHPELTYVYGVTAAEEAGESNPEPEQTPSQASSLSLGYVTDAAGILTEEQVLALDKEAEQLSQSLNFGVYIVVIRNYREYTNGDVNNCATDLYTYYDMGTGPNRDGLLLLMSMADRDYSIITHGFYGNYCFGDHNLTLIENAFLDNFRNNDWLGGFEDYLAVSGDVLRTAEAHGLTTDREDQSFRGLAFTGNTYRYGVTGKMPVGLKLAIGLGAPCLVALAVCSSFRAQMKTAKERTTAEDYVVPGSATLRIREDRFTHRTETRTPIQTSSGSSGRSSFGGGGGGGFSGHSGKF